MIPSLCNKKDADQWTYFGEGNENLIVKYLGDNQVYKGKLLRVIKNEKNIQCSTQDTIAFKKDFLDNVIQPLLGEEYVVPMSPVNTSIEFLQSLAANVEPFRPTVRKKKQIFTNSPISFLLNDLTQIWPDSHTTTFELKPKWGFKPTSSLITSNIKTECCRFCMHSYFREVPNNNFCPLDLYSYNPTRVQKALHVLLREAPLKKTLSISVNGKKVQMDSKFTSDNNTQQLHDILEQIILQDPILQIIKNLQIHLDEIDIEGIFSLCQQNNNHLALVTDNIDIWKDVVDRYKKRCQNGLALKSESLHDIGEQQQRVYEYVLSMIFKDCSLMINVAPNITQHKNNKIITLSSGISFQYDIKVIDTDLKSIDKIPYWFELDQSIIKHAMKTNFEKKCY